MSTKWNNLKKTLSCISKKQKALTASKSEPYDPDRLEKVGKHKLESESPLKTPKIRHLNIDGEYVDASPSD